MLRLLRTSTANVIAKLETREKQKQKEQYKQKEQQEVAIAIAKAMAYGALLLETVA